MADLLGRFARVDEAKARRLQDSLFRASGERLPFLSASLPAHLSAEVFVHGQRIWAGSRNATEEIAFPMGRGEGQFLARISNGMEVNIGYAERADGEDHILFIAENKISYGSLDRGLAEFIRRNVACLGQ